jgi:hypothetical protein
MNSISAIMAGAAICAVAFAQSATDPAGGGTAIAQMAKQAAPAGPTPRTADGKVDFSGVWSPEHTFIYDISVSLAKGETLPLQPWAADLTKKRMSHDDPEANCLPTGVPRQAPYPWRIVQTPTHIFFLFEGNIHSYRQIFMDGRAHPADPDPTWYGHSVGKWKGDTLSIDSVGFNDKFWFDFAGHPHTEQLHVIETFRRPDLGHLEFEATIDDPGAYTKPFTMHGRSTLQSGTELMEYICNENNLDVSHIVGKDNRK